MSEETHHCYICGETEGLEEHHIIPRAQGGEDLPTVWLCGVDHGLVHKQALNILSKNPYHAYFPAHQEQRGLYIARFIVAAIRQERENPNYGNPATLMVKTTKGTVALLHILKTDAGFSNLNDFVNALCRHAIESRFGASRQQTVNKPKRRVNSKP